MSGGGVVDDFATRLRSLREKRGYSLRELAELSGISYETIRSYEEGRRKNPDWYSLERLVRVLGTSQEYLRLGTGDIDSKE